MKPAGVLQNWVSSLGGIKVFLSATKKKKYEF